MGSLAAEIVDALSHRLEHGSMSEFAQLHDRHQKYDVGLEVKTDAAIVVAVAFAGRYEGLARRKVAVLSYYGSDPWR